MNGDKLLDRSIHFNKELESVKKETNIDFSWYPYGSLNNFIHLREILNERPITSLIEKQPKILDIGAADGDLSFFLESLSYEIDIIDYGPTNYNQLKGARLLKERLNSRVSIYEIDLDSQFNLPNVHYDLVFFLGILYHLKNPFYVLEALSRNSRHMILSTRVAQYTPDGTPISKSSLAYLLGPKESNNDPTNFWIFSETGLRRLFDRCGWEILILTSVGDRKASNPCDNDHDERVFTLLKSKCL